MDNALMEDIRTFVIKKIATNIEQFNLEPDENNELLMEIQTVEGQLSAKTKDKDNCLRACVCKSNTGK